MGKSDSVTVEGTLDLLTTMAASSSSSQSLDCVVNIAEVAAANCSKVAGDHGNLSYIHSNMVQAPRGLSLKERQSDSLSLKRIYDQLQTDNNITQLQLGSSIAAGGTAHDAGNRASRLGLDELIHRLSSKPASDAAEPGIGHQLTIFYCGTVNTFQAVPTEKAQAIMVLAAGCCSAETLSAKLAASVSTAPPNLAARLTQSTIKPSISTAAQISTTAATQTSAAASGPASGVSIKRPQYNKELPYARKVSLARFLGKRRDRMTTQMSAMKTSDHHEAAAAAAAMEDESKDQHCDQIHDCNGSHDNLHKRPKPTISEVN